MDAKRSAAIAGLVALLWLPVARSAIPAWCTPERLKSAGLDAASVSTDGGALPAADYMDSVAACVANPYSYTGHVNRPDAPWLTSERARAAAVLAKGSAEVLVVPFQVQGYGIDRAERALMTMELAEGLSQSRNIRVADPRFVSLALGEGFRRFDPSAILSVGRSSGASFALAGYVGHDMHHHMAITLQLIDLRAKNTPDAALSGKISWQHDWIQIPFSDEVPPAMVFKGLVPSVIREIPALGTSQSRKSEMLTPADRRSPFPAPLKAVTSKSATPNQAALLSLLGSLAGSYSDLPRERLFERALLASWHDAGGGRKFYTAYALFELQQRPAALAALGTDKDPASDTLRALLNGNLPDAEAGLERVEDPEHELLLSIALRDLQIEYGSKNRARPAVPKELFGTSAPAWRELVELRTDDRDPWTVVSPQPIQRAFDRSFPVGGLDSQSVAEGNLVAGRGMVDDVDLDIALIRHVHAVERTLQAEACCAEQGFAVTPADLLDLFIGQIEGRISKSIELQSVYQKLQSSALQALERYRPILDGHPLFSLARAQTAQAMLERASDDVRQSWATETGSNGLSAAYYAQGQNRLAHEALKLDADPFITEGYGYDYPLRSYWKPPYVASSAEREALVSQALAFSTSDPDPLRYLPPGNGPGQRGAVAAGLAGRFVGDPTRPSEIPLPGHPSLVMTGNRLADARAALQSSPGDWSNYLGLARAQIELAGDYAGAAETLHSYPEFKLPTPAERVSTSNRAYYAASLLCYQGQVSLCTPFLKIAASLQTGSSASLASENLLRVLSGDYRGALVGSLLQVQRYQDAADYREALVWLHAFGKSEQAWAGFSQVMASFDLPEVWTAALVGHRRAGFDEPRARAWMLRPEIRDAKFQGRQFAQYYAILFNATDRNPPDDLAKLVDQIEGAHENSIDGVLTIRHRGIDQSSVSPVLPSFFRSGKVEQLPRGTLIRSDLALFADAYVALRKEEFELAASKFNAMADHYDLVRGEDSFALPYLARAEAKSGDKDRLETALIGLKAEDSFDYWLSLASFAGARHETDAADAALKRAFRVRPSSLYRPIQTQFQYAEACEWLYKETGDRRFRDELMDWVKKWQMLRPADAWAYAVQYTYETAPEQRLRALAITMYLDPASPRIAAVTQADRARAQAWLREHSPFQMEANPRGPSNDASKTS